jgi:hypothetical protein
LAGFAFVFADKGFELNTSIWRAFVPGKALGRVGHTVAIIPIQLFQENKDEAMQACANSDFIIIERNLIGDVLTAMAFWKVRGKVIITNWDDAYDYIEPTNASYPYWKNGIIKYQEVSGSTETSASKIENKETKIFPHPLDQFKWGLKLSHAGITPSKQMAKDYRTYTPTYYFPNYFEIENYINVPKEKRDYITIGWGGSISHFQSFQNSGILEALKNICKIRPNVKIHIVGEQNVYNSIPVPLEQKLFSPYMPYEQWGKFVAQNFDIGIAPLAGKYDNYRSWIKPMEYMMTKTPFVASDGMAYHELLKYGHLLQVNASKPWERALLNIIDNYDKEKEFVSGLPYEFALTKDVNKNIDEMMKIFVEIAKKYAKIDIKYL